MRKGKVYLVGAGPGDSELITIKGLEAIKKADVILYDRLVNSRLIEYASDTCELIYCGKLPTRHFMKQEEINETLIEKALAGYTVVRLKGGDPSVFGRVGEEAAALAEHQLAYEIVPGITSGIAAPLYAGIPVTHRDYAGSFAIVTAHDKSKNGKPSIDWEGLARGVQTIAFYMGVSNLEHICENLIRHGKPSSTPVIIIQWGTWSRQRSIEGTLATISQKVREEKLENPAITLVGDIIATREKIRWFENKPLHGQQLLHVRGRAEEESYAKKLTELGADVIEFPKWKVYEGVIPFRERLSSYNKVLFTTPESVSQFLKLLRLYKFDIRQIKAKLYCRDTYSINLLEKKGLMASIEREMDVEGQLLIVGPKISVEPIWKLDYNYGQYDYAPVYETDIDKRYEEIISRSVEEAEPTSVLLSTADSVHTLMKESAHYGICLQSIKSMTNVYCLTKLAWQTASNYGLNATLLNGVDHVVEHLIQQELALSTIAY